MNRDYELMLVLHPDMDEQTITGHLDRLKGRISELGEVSDVDLLGRRKLAYEVRKVTQGIYVLIRFNASPENVAAVKQFMHIQMRDEVIRFLLILDEKRGPRPTGQSISPEAEVAAVAEEPTDEADSGEGTSAAVEPAEAPASEPAVGDEPAEAPAEAPAQEPAEESAPEVEES